MVYARRMIARDLISATHGVAARIAVLMSSMPKSSMQSHRQHVARRSVQDRVFGEIEQNCEAVTLAAAERDECACESLGRADDLRFDAARFHELFAVGKTEAL